MTVLDDVRDCAQNYPVSVTAGLMIVLPGTYFYITGKSMTCVAGLGEDATSSFRLYESQHPLDHRLKLPISKWADKPAPAFVTRAIQSTGENIIFYLTAVGEKLGLDVDRLLMSLEERWAAHCSISRLASVAVATALPGAFLLFARDHPLSWAAQHQTKIANALHIFALVTVAKQRVSVQDLLVIAFVMVMFEALQRSLQSHDSSNVSSSATETLSSQPQSAVAKSDIASPIDLNDNPIDKKVPRRNNDALRVEMTMVAETKDEEILRLRKVLTESRTAEKTKDTQMKRELKSASDSLNKMFNENAGLRDEMRMMKQTLGRNHQAIVYRKDIELFALRKANEQKENHINDRESKLEGIYRTQKATIELKDARIRNLQDRVRFLDRRDSPKIPNSESKVDSATDSANEGSNDSAVQVKYLRVKGRSSLDIESLIQDKDNEIANLKADLSNAASAVTSLSNTQDELRRAWDASYEARTALDEEREHHTQTQDKLREAALRLEELLIKPSPRNSFTALPTIHEQELETMFNTAQDENTRLQGEVEASGKRVKELEASDKKAKEDRKELEAMFNTAQEEHLRLRGEVETSEKKVEELEASEKTVKADKEELEAILDTAREEHLRLRGEVEAAEKRVREVEASEKRVKDDKKGLEAILNTAQEEHLRLRDEVETSEKKVRELEASDKKARDGKKELEAMFTTAQKENSRLHSEVEASQNRVREVKKELEAMFNAAQEENTRLRGEMEASERRVEEDKKELDAMFSAAQEENSRLHSEMEASEKRVREDKGELEAMFNAAQDENSRLHDDMEAAEKKARDNLEAAEKRARDDKNELLIVFNAAQDENSRLHSEMEAAEKRARSNLEAVEKRAKDDKDELLTVFNAAQDENSRLHSEMEATEKRVRDDKKELEAMFNAAQDENLKLHGEVEAFEKRVREANARIFAAEKEVGALTEQLKAEKAINEDMAKAQENLRQLKMEDAVNQDMEKTQENLKLHGEVAVFEKRVREANARIFTVEKEVEALREQVRVEKAVNEDMEKARPSLVHRVHFQRMEGQLREARTALSAKEAEVAKLKKGVAEKDKKADSLTKEKVEAVEACTKAEEENEELKKSVATLESTKEQLMKDHERLAKHRFRPRAISSEHSHTSARSSGLITDPTTAEPLTSNDPLPPVRPARPASLTPTIASSIPTLASSIPTLSSSIDGTLSSSIRSTPDSHVHDTEPNTNRQSMILNEAPPQELRVARSKSHTLKSFFRKLGNKDRDEDDRKSLKDDKDNELEKVDSVSSNERPQTPPSLPDMDATPRPSRSANMLPIPTLAARDFAVPEATLEEDEDDDEEDHPRPPASSSSSFVSVGMPENSNDRELRPKTARDLSRLYSSSGTNLPARPQSMVISGSGARPGTAGSEASEASEISGKSGKSGKDRKKRWSLGFGGSFSERGEKGEKTRNRLRKSLMPQ